MVLPVHTAWEKKDLQPALWAETFNPLSFMSVPNTFVFLILFELGISLRLFYILQSAQGLEMEKTFLRLADQ